MTEPLITEDPNPNPDEVTDDGLGMTEPEVVTDADVDEEDDRVRAGVRCAVHSAPKTGSATRLRYLPEGRLARFYQYVEGESFDGDRTWGANDDGTEFIHFKKVHHEGGST
jgi:hypothetical protein